MTMDCSLPWPCLAETFKMPFVNIKSHLDLRHSAWRRWDVRQIKPAERFVMTRLLAFTLQHVNRHRGLVVSAWRRLGSFCRNGRFNANQHAHHLTHGLDAQR